MTDTPDQRDSNSDLRWIPAKGFCPACVDDVFRDWKGTPYADGQQVRKQGVDCVRFVGAVWDALFDRDPTPIPRLHPGTSLHDREAAMSVIRAMLEHTPCDRVIDGTVQAGDALVTRSYEGTSSVDSPGHVMIASSLPGEVFQATRGVGVHRARIEACRVVLRIYRPREKHLWPQSA
jgi:hypothetical protein